MSVGFTDGTAGTYDLMVGADGIHSRLRAMLFPDAPKPAFTGRAAGARWCRGRPQSIARMFMSAVR